MASSKDISIAVTLGAIALLITLALAALSVFGAHIYLSVLVFAFLFLSIIVLLLQADEKGRDDISQSLNAVKYTQFYCYVSQRLTNLIWPRVCDKVANDATPLATFRAALTWRLYDKALLFAVAYPIFLLVGFWIFSFPAQDGKLGSITVLEAAAFWPERAVTLGAIALVLISVKLEKWAAASPKVVLRKVSGWLPLIALAFAFALAFAVTVAFAFTVTVAVAVAGTGAVAVAFALAFAVAFAVAVVFAGAFVGAGAVAVVFAGAGAGAVAFVGAVTVAVAVEYMDKKGENVLARWLVTLAVPFGWILALLLLPWGNISGEARAIFVLLGVFPLINALFDVVSYAVTLTLLRLGLRARLPLLYGFYDLIAATILFLALGGALAVILAGMNRLAGTPLVDLESLFGGARHMTSDFRWLYFMLFSTMAPTALHFAISLLGAQGLTPRFVRKKVAVWVNNAPESTVNAALTPFAVGAIYTVPVGIFLAVSVVVWNLGQGAIEDLGAWYFDWLLGLGHWVGAF